MFRPDSPAERIGETPSEALSNWRREQNIRIVGADFSPAVSDAVVHSVASASPSFGERYRVERELGRGGMATVYLCTDTKFDRRVAIKLLNPELAAAVGADRFHREIKIATGLTHPNILPAHDSGEANGSLYYVMPFVEGESLRDRLTRERQLSVQTAVTITCEIASALQYAHSRGIIHRDIKPENILIESEHAVLADFGIARAVTSVADVEALTQTGMALGTPSYMSPEQAMGEKHLDGRSDQYSLACVTYEMLAGYPPFMANTMQALIAKHLGEPVPLITTVRPAVPDELEDVILRALEKVPADRFASMQEFADSLAAVIATTGTWMRRTTARTAQVRTTRSNRAIAATARSRRRRIVIGAAAAVLLAGSATGLWAWNRGKRGGASGAGVLDRKSVAVLYFEDLSRDHSLAHAADGLTEGLIDELKDVRGLKVVSSRGVATYRASSLPVDSIARALQVGSLIAGGIEPVGDRVRVQLRLVDGNTGVDAKRASFELPANQLLAVLDSVSKAAAQLLRSQLGGEVRLQESRAGTSSTDAWTRVQLAERLRKQADSVLDSKNQTNGVRLLEQADSNLALAERADAAWLQPMLARGWIAYRRSELEQGLAAAPWLDTALYHAERALKHEPRNPDALTLRGATRYLRWRLRIDADPASQQALLQSARSDLEGAIAADPSQARANIELSRLYYGINDVSGALLAARRAYEEDPYLEQAAYALNRLFWGSVDLEQFDNARRWCAEGARRFPQDRRFVQCQLWLLVTPAIPRSDVDLAWRLLARLDSVAPAREHAFMLAEGRILVAGAIARAGRVDSAKHVLRSVHGPAITSDVDPHEDLLSREAYVRTLMNDEDGAIDLLKRYVAANPEHDVRDGSWNAWWWRKLRQNPRWHEVAQPGR
jgi:serine/threonine-protein kinase